MIRSPGPRPALWLCALVAALLLVPAAAHATTLRQAQMLEPLRADALAAPAAAAAVRTGFVSTTIFNGLTAPSAIRFAPDGRVFVAESDGRVLVFDNTNDTTPTLYADLRQNTVWFGDRGLLGLAIDPQFTTGRPYIYVLYTYDAAIGGTAPKWNDVCPSNIGADQDGCVASARLSRIDPQGRETVLINDWCQHFSSHSIGALNFGPDGALYASGGDGASFIYADYGDGGNPKTPCGDPPGGVGGVMDPPTAEGGALRSQD